MTTPHTTPAAILPELLDLIRFQQEYIVAIPSDVAASLPAMPGFDGDWAVDLVERAKALAASAPTPEGFVQAPHYRGYANLGTGQYVLNHTAPHEPAELIISIASDEDKAGRTIGDDRGNPAGKAIQPDEMAVRLAFTSVAGLDALEKQLRYLREVHFPQAAPVAPTQREEEMSMLIRRIVSSARRNCEDNSNVLKLANEAWSYLARNGLTGSALRDEGIASAAPVAPAPQPAPMPYPTDAQIDAVYEQTMGQHLRSQDAPAVRRFGRAMFLCAWNAAAPKADQIEDGLAMVPAPLQQGEYPETLYEGGRESVDDALAVVESFGPGVQGLNDTFARQVLLGQEVRRLRAAYEHACQGRSDFRNLYRAARGAAQEAPAPVAEDAEDAANWKWLAAYLVGPRTDRGDEIVASESVNALRKLVSAARAQAAQPEGGAA